MKQLKIEINEQGILIHSEGLNAVEIIGICEIVRTRTIVQTNIEINNQIKKQTKEN